MTGSVTVDDGYLRRHGAEWETDPIPIEFRGDTGPVDAIDALQRAVDATDQGLDSPTGVAVDTFALMGGGAAVVVIHHGLDGLLVWLEQLASALSESGHTGELRFAEEHRLPIGFPGPRLGCTVAGLVFEGQAVPHATTARLAADAVDWAMRLDGDLYFTHHGVTTRIDPTRARELLQAAVLRSIPVSVCTLAANSDFRNVLFAGFGRVVYEHRRDDAREHEAVELIEVLRTHAATLDYGFVRVASGPSVAWWEALTNDEPRPPAATGTYYKVLRDREASHVPDAYGVQVLTEQHMGNAHDLSGWDVAPVRGRYLVKSRQADQWFRPAGPPPAVVRAARNDFGGMIISEELIREGSRRERARRFAGPRG